MIDCQLHLQDGPATRHALELARSFGARVWDNSPLQMKQIPQIGIVSVRKLVMAGINSIDALESTEANRLDLLLSKNPGYGEKLLAGTRSFPKPMVTVKFMGKVCFSHVYSGRFYRKEHLRKLVGSSPINRARVRGKTPLAFAGVPSSKTSLGRREEMQI